MGDIAHGSVHAQSVRQPRRQGTAFSHAPLGNHRFQRAWVAGREATQEPDLWGATALPGFFVSGGGEAFVIFLYVPDPHYVWGYASV